VREILFKAKRIDNGEWVEGFLIYFEASVGENTLCLIVGSAEWTNDGKFHDFCNTHRVDESTICQYTGLTDKNGNKIWENDVVEVWWKQRTLKNDYEPQRHKAKIEFGNPNSLYSWGYQLHFVKDFPFNPDILFWIDMEEAGAYCEVIGNIFDNPELLGGGE
jgi:uncharacterized phage protein (TIGR01671 family)